MIIKELLKKNKFICEKYTNHKKFGSKYTFDNRSKGSDTVCIILAGYKAFTWDIVFERIKKFAPKNIDICIISSGVNSDRLREIAKDNNWSYLAVKRNCVTMTQNIAIKLFDKAKYIYKIDEDIFVTENLFTELKHTYDMVDKSGEYKVGFVAPLIPINGYGHVKILNILGLTSYYEKHFESVKYIAGRDRMIESSPEVAKFMWGEGGKVPQIDILNKKLAKMPFQYSACPIRFSIGAMYFSRELWKDMGYFRVEKGPCMGLDETQVCSFCVCSSRAMIISHNTCVGHLSFGTQNSEMEKYFKKHSDRFKITSGE